MNFPKVLILCEKPITEYSGMGLYLASMFSGWTQQNLFELYSSSIKKEVESNIAGCKRVDVPGHYGRRYFIPYFLGLTPAWRGKYSKFWLLRTLAGFRPQLVYSHAYLLDTLAYASWAAEVYSVPHIAHPTDNTFDLNESTRPQATQIFRDASVRLAISEEMKTAFEERYGMPFSVLNKGAEPELFDAKYHTRLATQPLTIRYIGALYKFGHLQSIEDVIDAVKKFNQSVGKACLEIYGGESTKEVALSLADNENVFYCGTAEPEEIHMLLQTADVLLLPITFDSEQFEQLRYSLSSKLCECLASGTPTLIYGPRGMATVEYCLRNNVGFVQSTRSVDNLFAFLKSAKEAPEQLRVKAKVDRQFAKENLSADSARRKFYDFVDQSLKQNR